MSEDQPWTTTPPDAAARLAPFRARIDDLDARIVALLGERFGVIREVAAAKGETGIHPVIADRVEEVVQRARSAAGRAGVDPELVERLYRILIDASCRLEAELIAAARSAEAEAVAGPPPDG